MDSFELRRCLLAVSLSSITMLSGLFWPLASGWVTSSWNENYIVPAGANVAASGGRLGVSQVNITGTLRVQSCCGYSTNDIMFSIVNQNGDSHNYGVVTGIVPFKWYTFGDSEYSLVFNNKFNLSSPSYHDKTVYVSVTETSTLQNPLVNFFVQVLVGVGVASVIGLFALFIYFKTRKRSKLSPMKSQSPFS